MPSDAPIRRVSQAILGLIPWVHTKFFSLVIVIIVVGALTGLEIPSNSGWAMNSAESSEDQGWLGEIEKIFTPSTRCKQCHDRHFEEWKGMRERSEDLCRLGEWMGL